MILFFKQWGVLGIVLIGLGIISAGINALPWEWLTSFFIIFRNATKPLDFMWDFNTSFTILSSLFSILSLIYGLKAVLTIKAYFS